MLPLLPLIASALVSTSSKVAIDSVVKMVVPVGIKALPSFGIKMGTIAATTVVGWKLGTFIRTNVADIISTVQGTAQEETPAQEDN